MKEVKEILLLISLIIAIPILFLITLYLVPLVIMGIMIFTLFQALTTLVLWPFGFDPFGFRSKSKPSGDILPSSYISCGTGYGSSCACCNGGSCTSCPVINIPDTYMQMGENLG
jgi:hypothetical protein